MKKRGDFFAFFLNKLILNILMIEMWLPCLVDFFRMFFFLIKSVEHFFYNKNTYFHVRFIYIKSDTFAHFIQIIIFFGHFKLNLCPMLMLQLFRKLYFSIIAFGSFWYKEKIERCILCHFQMFRNKPIFFFIFGLQISHFKTRMWQSIILFQHFRVICFY